MILPRTEAERRYGMRLYQGGAVPGKELFVLDITDWDVEACGGTHVKNTKEIGMITILNTEKIQDGVVRITFAAGSSAEKALLHRKELLEEAAKILNVPLEEVPQKTKELIEQWKKIKKELEMLRKQKAKTERLNIERIKDYEVLIQKFDNANMHYLREISRQLTSDKRFLFLVGISDRIYVFCSVGSEFVKQGINGGQIVAELCKKLGGGGGGPPHKGEGTIPIQRKPQIEQLFKDVKRRIERRLIAS